ncbi:MAG: hypothetical protein LBC43_04395 [Bifidobacteriaceae bacterium]|jgi:hypothetical protein|nr:hypothetical protein [Bifidobacteriaceae bacterium]
MSDDSARDSAERFVFSNNAQQNRTFNTFGLFYIPSFTLAVSAVAFISGFGDQDYVIEVFGFILAVFGLAGLFFAIWAKENKANYIQNTYLTMTGTVVEVAAMMIGLAGLGARLTSSEILPLFYFLPALGYVVGFFISFIVAENSAKHYKGTTSRTTAFGSVMVMAFIAILIGGVISTFTEQATQDWSKSAIGIGILGAGALATLILGLLTAIAFVRNLLVKMYNIDLSRLYNSNETTERW